MNLAIFDLDDTLLQGDSDSSWGFFISSKGYADGYAKKNEYFRQEYLFGRLDINEYVAQVAQIFNNIPPAKLEELFSEYIEQIIIPMIKPKGLELIKSHKAKGDHTMIITATNELVASRVCPLFKVDTWFGTKLEVTPQGVLTGKILGIPTFQKGKVEHIKQWLDKHSQYSLKNCWFYSDSINDFPLLAEVGYPVAVDPDKELAATAAKNNWKTIQLTF